MAGPRQSIPNKWIRASASKQSFAPPAKVIYSERPVT
jgi:hypothetical protein